jgi:hypothetical protein
MTQETQPQTFHGELEDAFDKGAQAPLLIQHPNNNSIVMSVELFDEMIAKGEFDLDEIKHNRVIRSEGKADVVIMPTDSYADLLDRTQEVTPIDGNALKAALRD